MNATQKPRALTPRETADLEQGWLAFSVQAPFRPMLRLTEAAEALGLVWHNSAGEERRFDTEFIIALLDRGELEGISDEGANPQTEGLKKLGRSPKAWRRVSRVSLMAYCARKWTLPPEEAAGMILDWAMNLPSVQQRKLGEALIKQADALAGRMVDGYEKLNRHSHS